MQNCISGDVNLGEHIISESLKFCAAIDKEKSSEINRFQRALVRVARLERAASTSQSEFRSFLLQIIANYTLFAFFVAIFVHF